MTTTLPFPEHTVAEVLDQLRHRGYHGTFRIEDDTIPPGLCCDTCHRRLLAHRVHVAETWRFEGASDPDDEAIILAFACPRCATPGTLTSVYGPRTTPAEAAVLTALGRPDLDTPHRDET